MGANKEALLPLVPILYETGYALLLFDAHSLGRRDDVGFSTMLKFSQNLEHAYDWLGDQPGVDKNHIAYLGHSLGGAAALLSASHRPQLTAVVCISTFAHSVNTIRQRLARHHIPWWPLGWCVAHYMQYRIGVRYDDIAPINTIKKIKQPVLLIHGDHDKDIPVSDMQSIYESSGRKNVSTCILSNTGHNAILRLKRNPEKLLGFLGQVVASRI